MTGPWSAVFPILLACPSASLCVRPYHNHPRGCPNFGKRPSCPPAARGLSEVLNPFRHNWVIWNAFPMADHLRMMRRKHPDWSEYQLRCCLYWQGTARKQLREHIARFRVEHPGTVVLRCPEAHGVDVSATMERVGITLEWPPTTVAYQVALAGYPAGPA